MKAHLLYPDQDFDMSAPVPPHCDDLVRDLELRTLTAAMAGSDEFLAGVAGRVLLSPPGGPEAVRHRQAVLQDFMREPVVLRELYSVVVGALDLRRRLWGYSSSLRRPQSLLTAAREHLEMYVGQLKALRSLADRFCSVVASPGLLTLFASMQDDLNDEYLGHVEHQLKRIHFSEGLLLSAGLARDNTGEGYALRVPERDRPGWKERLGMAPRSVYSFSIAPRDEAGGQALDDLRSRGLDQVANAVAQSADHITDYFELMRVELGFYVGCVNLADKLFRAGQQVCIPEVAPLGTDELSFRDLTDACLVLEAGHQVVGNDADADGKTIVVVTGANSGGKSTFLRSVGIAQLMTQAGMFVTAGSYRASVVSGVFTHFLREEDASMTRGRLEEELARMSDLAKSIEGGSLVLFNESFHSTNEREGSEIARQIVRALREARCRVVFVSHQYDFSRTYSNDDETAALFMRAELGEGGRPDYHLLTAPPLSTAYGPDLYRQIFGADDSC